MPGKIALVNTTNPLDPADGRATKFVDARPGYTALDAAREFYPLAGEGLTVLAAVNGVVLKPSELASRELETGDVVALWVDLTGANAGRTAAMFAIIVGSIIAAAPSGGQSLWLGLSAAQWIGVGLAVGGAVLMNTVFKPPVPGAPLGFEGSDNYGWDTRRNRVSEGGILPRLYGTYRFAPPLISNHITAGTDDPNKQHLNLLYALAEGEIDAIAEEDVFVNGEPAENFTDLEINFRPGLTSEAAQPVIDWFNDTVEETAVGAALEDEFTTAAVLTEISPAITVDEEDWSDPASTTGSSVNTLGVTLSFPDGLFQSSGGLFYTYQSASFTVQVKDYEDADWSGATDYEFTITCQLRQEFGRTLFIHGLTPGRYTARVKDTTSDYDYVTKSPPTTSWVGLDERPPESPVLRTTSGDGVERLGVGLLMPKGCYAYDANGSVSAETVYIRVEYRPQGGTDADWIGQNVTITEASDSPVRRLVMFEYTEPDRYEVRAYYLTPPTLSDKRANEVWFDYLHEAVTDDFRYPGVALLALRALATDQLSGSLPSVEVVATRADIEWDELGEAKASSSPAWAAYDLLRYAGAAADELDLTAFTAWDAFCTTNGHECNIYLDQEMSLNTALAQIAACGRAAIVQRGREYSVVIDQDGTPAQLFSMGNIVAGSFRESWLPLSGRANALEVVFFDADQDYKRTAIELREDGLDASETNIRRSSVTLYGVTDHDQAVDLGSVILNMARLCTRAISFEADIDALAVEPGDLIYFQHDAPAVNEGGRVAAATVDEVTLDHAVTLEEGTSYTLTVRHQDTDVIESASVTVPAGGATSATITLATSLDNAPEAGAVFIFGEDAVSTFRVSSITQSEEHLFRVEATEHQAAVYSGSVSVSLPPAATTVTLLAGLEAGETWHVFPDGSGETRAELTWRGAALNYRVSVSEGGNAYRLLGVTDQTWFTARGLPVGVELTFQVAPSGDASAALTDTITLAGKTGAPDPATSLAGTSGLFDNELAWTASADRDVAAYQVWSHTANDRASASQLAVTDATRYQHHLDDNTVSHYYWVRAVDASGNLSAWEPSGATSGVELTPADGVIDEGYLAEGLSGRIDLIDTIDDVYEAGVLESGIFGALWDDVYSANKSVIEHLVTLTSHESTLSQHAATIANLDAQISDIVASDFDEDSTYAVGAYVRYEGEVYRCIKAVTSTPAPAPTNTTYWELSPNIVTLASNIEARIDDVEGELATLATQVSFDLLESRVSVNETSITQNASDITLKAAQTDLDTLDGRVTSAESDITVNAAAIALRVTSTDFSDFQALMAPEFDEDQTYEAGEYVRDSGALYECILDIESTPAPGTSNATYWAERDSLTGELATATSEITVNAASISLHAEAITGGITFEDDIFEDGVFVEDAGDVDGLDVRLSRAEIDLDALDASITLSVSNLETDVAEATATLASVQTELDAVSASLTSYATFAQLTSATARLTIAEEKLDALAGVITHRLTRLENDVIVAGIEEEIALVETDVDTVLARYTLKIQSGDRIAGLVFANDSEVSTCIFQTDVFQVIDPDGAEDAVSPFTVTASGVQIDGSLLVSGSVTADHIAASTITADEIATGTITASQLAGDAFGTFTLTAGAVEIETASGLTIKGGANMVVEEGADIQLVGDAADPGKLVFTSSDGNNVEIYPTEFTAGDGEKHLTLWLVPDTESTGVARLTIGGTLNRWDYVDHYASTNYRWYLNGGHGMNLAATGLSPFGPGAHDLGAAGTTYQWDRAYMRTLAVQTYATAPSAVTGYGQVYAKTDGKLYFKTAAGVEHEIAFAA